MNATTTAWKLREVLPAEASQLAEFGARTFFDSFAADNTEEDMRRHLASAWSPAKQLAEIQDADIDTLVLVDEAGRWLGFAQLRANRVSDVVPREASVELWRFYIDKPFHGSGMAGALMDGVKQRAHRRGASSLWLGVWERNARAKAFYAKQGFRKVGSHVFVVGTDPQTDDVMLCALA